MSKICSSRNLGALERINNGLQKNMLFLELAFDSCFEKDTVNEFAQDLLFDALQNMKKFVVMSSQFECCLRSEEDIKEDSNI